MDGSSPCQDRHEGTPERPTGGLLEWSHVWERGVGPFQDLLRLGGRAPSRFLAGRPSGRPGSGSGQGLREAEAAPADLLPSLWPGPALGLLSRSQPPFLRPCRCFRRQSQGAPEGRASAHVVLKGGLRGR